MKKTLGILMIMVGAGMFSFSGFNKQNGNKVMTDNGMIKDAPVVKSKSFNWFPYAGAVLFMAGIAVTTSRPKK
jgi:hypothetical protein